MEPPSANGRDFGKASAGILGSQRKGTIPLSSCPFAELGAGLFFSLHFFSGAFHLKCFFFVLFANSCKVLIQTYEMAPIDELMPYFRERFKPLIPQYLVGRSATLYPQARVSRTCFDWYKDPEKNYTFP